MSSRARPDFRGRPRKHMAWPISERHLAFLDVDWRRFEKCPRCRAQAGQPCRAIEAATGQVVSCEAPHRLRRRSRPTPEL